MDRTTHALLTPEQRCDLLAEMKRLEADIDVRFVSACAFPLPNADACGENERQPVAVFAEFILSRKDYARACRREDPTPSLRFQVNGVQVHSQLHYYTPEGVRPLLSTHPVSLGEPLIRCREIEEWTYRGESRQATASLAWQISVCQDHIHRYLEALKVKDPTAEGDPRIKAEAHLLNILATLVNKDDRLLSMPHRLVDYATQRYLESDRSEWPAFVPCAAENNCGDDEDGRVESKIRLISHHDGVTPIEYEDIAHHAVFGDARKKVPITSIRELFLDNISSHLRPSEADELTPR